MEHITGQNLCRYSLLYILLLRAKLQTAMKLLICALERGDRLICVTVANGWTPLIIVTKSSVFNVAGILDSFLLGACNTA